MRTVKVAWTGLLLLAAGCAGPAVMPAVAPATGTVTGVVRHAITGEPVPDVAIVVQNVAPRVEAETDTRGEFLLINVPAGKQVIVAVKDGWKPDPGQGATIAEVRPGQNAAVPVIRLAPP